MGVLFVHGCAGCLVESSGTTIGQWKHRSCHAGIRASVETDEANLVPTIQDEPPSDVSQALRSLQAIDSFRHIDPELAVQVEDCKRFGPELNALMTIRNEQRSPVAGALVAVVESARDRFGRLGPSFIDQPMDSLPIAMAVTDREGRVAFEHVRRSHNHYDVESSVPRAYLLVLHPDYAWRLHRLDHHDGPQEADITLATPRTLRGKLTAEGKPVEGAVVSISEYWFHKARFVDPALAELWECPSYRSLDRMPAENFASTICPRDGRFFHQASTLR